MQADVNEIIILCNILDLYKDLCNDISQYKYEYSDEKLLNKLSDKSKKTLEIFESSINKIAFIKHIINKSLDFYYKYIIENIDQKDYIINLLKHIRLLGINILELNENLKINEYELYFGRSFSSNITIKYLDNLQLVDLLENNGIKYTSTDSNYIIMYPVDKFSDMKNNVCVKISVNSLLFDINTLPLSSSYNDIVMPIIKLSESKNYCLHK